MRAVLTRPTAVRRARLLNGLTIGWNTAEGVIALAAGMAAGSVSLIGFGLDSAIEVSAALILAWRLKKENDGGCSQGYDRRAQLLIAISFAALAGYVSFEAIQNLTNGTRPDISYVGIALAAISLAAMPVLAKYKARLAPVLGSRAAQAEASQTGICALLSATTLAGLGAHAAFGWWWADPVAALAIAGVATFMAYRTWQAESLEDTCCR